MFASNKTPAKRPSFTLALPDPAPMQAVIAAVKAQRARLAQLAEEKQRRQKTVDDYIATSDDDDDARHQEIVTHRVRLEQIPNIEARVRSQLPALHEPVFEAVRAFYDAMLAQAQGELNAYLDAIEEHISPFAPPAIGKGGASANRARNIAQRFPVRAIIPDLFTRLEQGKPKDRHNREQDNANGSDETKARRCEEHLADAIKAAERGLEYHDRTAKAGRFLHTPEELPGVEKAAADAAEKAEADVARREREESKRGIAAAMQTLGRDSA